MVSKQHHTTLVEIVGHRVRVVDVFLKEDTAQGTVVILGENSHTSAAIATVVQAVMHFGFVSTICHVEFVELDHGQLLAGWLLMAQS